MRAGDDAGDATGRDKSAEAYRTISEVSAQLGVPQHVLRFWEAKFPQLRPLKRAGGRRYYRPVDIEALQRIRRWLYEDGLTIKGVQKKLRERGGRAGAAPEPETDPGAEASAPSESGLDDAAHAELSAILADMRALRRELARR